MQLKYSEQHSSWQQNVADAISALALSVSFVALWVSGLGLEWSFGRILKGNPLKGLLSAWNQLAEALGKSVYMLLPRFSGGYSDAGEAMPTGAFLTLSALLLAGLIFLMIRSRMRPWLLLFLLPWIFLMFVADIAPGFPYMLAFTGALAVAWVQMGGGTFRQGTAIASIALVLAMTLGIGIWVDRAYSFDPAGLTGRTGALMERVLHARYGSGALKNGQLNSLSGKALAKERGSLSKRQSVLTGGSKDKTKTALEVKGKEMDSYYLRGYVGEKYRGNRWEPLQTSVYYEGRDTLYWLNKGGFDGLSQMSNVAALVDEEAEKKALSIKVKHADRSQLYIPYEMRGTAKILPKGSRNYAGSFLGSSRLFGSRSYKLNCGNNMTGSWTDWVGQLYSAGFSPEISDYFRNESHYNVWCYQKDTEVPEQLWETLYTELGDPGEQTGNHMDYKEAISITQDYLAQNYVYSDNFRKMSRKKDFLAGFLKSRKGCDVHYASLATMIFRYYRIPARYVEGYLLTPADVEKGGKVELGQSHQHAWTEIYVDGYGWVPIETCPDYQGIMEEADMETGLESMSYDSTMQETPPPESDEADESEDLDNVSKLLRKAGITIGIAVLSLFLLLLLIFLGRRSWKAWRRHKDFTHPQPRHGICAMYGYMLEEKLPLSETAVTIGDAAAFSPLEMEEKHRTQMKDELVLSKVKGKRARKEERKRKWKERKLPKPWKRRKERRA